MKFQSSFVLYFATLLASSVLGAHQPVLEVARSNIAGRNHKDVLLNHVVRKRSSGRCKSRKTSSSLAPTSTQRPQTKATSSADPANASPQVQTKPKAQAHVKPQAQSQPSPSPKPVVVEQPSPAKAAPAPQNNNPPSAGSTSNTADEQAYLDAHNTVRAAHGASALTWSDELAAKAASWANNCQFKHSGGTLGPFGENLAAGSGDYPIANAVKSWADEEPEYHANDPQASHYTQMVWKGSKQLGCAVVSCNLDVFTSNFWPAKFYVCEYSPQGNIIGQFAENVQ